MRFHQSNAERRSFAARQQEEQDEEFGSLESLGGTAGSTLQGTLGGTTYKEEEEGGGGGRDRQNTAKVGASQPSGQPESEFSNQMYRETQSDPMSRSISELNTNKNSSPARTNPNTSLYNEDDSVLLWTDDPEKEYFAYMLQQEQEERARRGKAEEDSLVGNSTLNEMLQTGPWLAQGGNQYGPGETDTLNSSGDLEGSTMDGYSLAAGTFSQQPAPSSFKRGFSSGRGSSTVDNYSLATSEKSSSPRQPNSKQVSAMPIKVTQSDPSIPEPNAPVSPVCNRQISSLEVGSPPGRIYPDVIFVKGRPATPATVHSNLTYHKDDEKITGYRTSAFRQRWMGRAFFIMVALLCCVALAAAAIAIYLSQFSNVGNHNGSNATSTQSSALENTNASNGPTGSNAAPTPYPSVLLQKRTLEPTFGLVMTGKAITAAPIIAPTLLPRKNFDLTTAPSEATVAATTTAPTVAPTLFPRKTFEPSTAPSEAMVTGDPSGTPSVAPTWIPTRVQATAPNTLCGCKECFSSTLAAFADSFTCKDRIDFLMYQRGYSEVDACHQVAGQEFVIACSGRLCDPRQCVPVTPSTNTETTIDVTATKPPTITPTLQPSLPPTFRADPVPHPTSPYPSNVPTNKPATRQSTFPPITPRPSPNPTPRPSLRPTNPVPTPMPTLRPTSLDLVVLGDGGQPRSAFPLGRCQGDCDTDSDCDVGLVCFQRYAGGVAVPGCRNGELDGTLTDYCVPGDALPTQTSPPTGTSPTSSTANNNYIQWETYYWDDLPSEVQQAYGDLGWDRNTWNNDGSVPTDNMPWSSLSRRQQNAALYLGYTTQSWDSRS